MPRFSPPTLLLLAGLAVTGGTEPLATPAPEPGLAGFWVGTITDLRSSYEVCMRVPDDLTRDGAITYFAGISCGGTVHYEGEAGGVHKLTEKLTFGTVATGGWCVATGRIEARIKPDGALRWEWFQPNSSSAQAKGVLERRNSCPRNAGARISLETGFRPGTTRS